MSKKNIIFMKDFVESTWGSISDEPLLQGTTSQLTLEQDYKLCIVEINKFMSTICTQKIDASAFGTKTPDHFNDYVTQLSNAKSAATNLLDLTTNRLKNLPKIEIDSLTDIQEDLRFAIDRVAELEKDPSKTSEIHKMEIAIDSATASIKYLINKTKSLLEYMDVCTSDVDKQSDSLLNIANLMLTDKDIDQEKIKKLNATVKELRTQINTKTGIAVAMGIASGALIGLGVFAVKAAGPAGYFVWIFVAAGVAVAGAYMALNIVEINKLKAQLQIDLNDVDGYTFAVNALVEHAKEYKSLAESSKSMKDKLNVLISEWEKILNGFNAIKSELDNASKWESQTWSLVKSELQRAVDKDKMLCEQLEKLKLSDILIIKQPLEVGMSAEETKAFAEKAGMIPFEEFIA